MQRLPAYFHAHLQHSRAYLELWAVQQLLQLDSTEVADADAAREACSYTRLHCRPGLASAGRQHWPAAACDGPAEEHNKAVSGVRQMHASLSAPKAMRLCHFTSARGGNAAAVSWVAPRFVTHQAHLYLTPLHEWHR